MSWMLPRLVGRHPGGRSAAVGPGGHRRPRPPTGACGTGSTPTARPHSPRPAPTRALLATTVGPNAVTTTKRQIYDDLLRHDAAASVGDSQRLLDEAMGTAEYREGIAAMRDRRPPRFDQSARTS